MKSSIMNKAVSELMLAAGFVGLACHSQATIQSSSEVWVGSCSAIQGSGGTSSKVSFFSQRMIRPLETAGVVSGLQSAVLTDTNSTWADGQFGTNGVPAFVEFDNGWMADIANCSAGAHCLALAGSLGGAVPQGVAYRIRKHFTIASMFGAHNEAGLKAGFNPSVADNILLIIPQTQQVITIFYYDDGTLHGWMDATFAPADNMVIYPEQGVMVRRRVDTALGLYLVGPVKSGSSVVTIDVGNNLVGTLKSATALTLSALNLYTGDPATGLAGGFNPSVTDNIIVVAPDGSSATYFYYKDATFEGWLDAAFNSAETAQINPGSAFFIRRKSPNAAFNWTIPAE